MMHGLKSSCRTLILEMHRKLSRALFGLDGAIDLV
jgi:hypothetical protein